MIRSSSNSRFKPGDTVRRIAPGVRNVVMGGVYTVHHENGFRLTLVDDPDESYETDFFQLVEPVPPTGLTLSPEDPFEFVLIVLTLLNRRKRSDYTSKGSSAWENFDNTEARIARRYGLDQKDIFNMAVDAMLFTKDTRLDALVTRDGPQNESADDTIQDAAVYALIKVGRLMFPDGTVPPEQAAALREKIVIQPTGQAVIVPADESDAEAEK